MRIGTAAYNIDMGALLVEADEYARAEIEKQDCADSTNSRSSCRT